VTRALAAQDTAVLADWGREISMAGGCSHPVRLRGKVTAVDRATGEAATVYDTSVSEPSGVLHVACGNRREAACPACSAIYKRDARQLVKAGLAGGKGVPDSIAEHPCVFATFTAPGFGPVHSRREKNGQVRICRPRRDASKRACPHGRDISCPIRHSPDDPRVGRPMCPDCFDYERAVVFNAGAPKLWQRFVTYLPRHLARVAGMRVTDCRELVKPRFFKVTEYQVRGVVHYHAVIRLDANVKDENAWVHPGPLWTAELLARAVKAAAAQASVLFPVGRTGRSLLLRFGAESGFADTRIIRSGTATAVSREAVANYVAKYATKVSDVPGMPSGPIRDLAEIQALRCSAHHKRLIETAFRLGFAKGAHQFGNHGHFLSKSRRYSVTFGYIRRERVEHRKAQRWPDGELDPWGRPLDERVVLVVKDFTFAGNGYAASDAHFLALMSADNARNN
jgi:hypothetical protein